MIINKKNLFYFLFLISLVFISSCETPKLDLSKDISTFKIREFQTRTYDTTDTKIVIKGVINALQDTGFVIKSLNTDIGLITAEKTFQTINKLQMFLYGPQTGYDVATVVEGNINVDIFGDKTRVRAGFIKKLSTLRVEFQRLIQ